MRTSGCHVRAAVVVASLAAVLCVGLVAAAGGRHEKVLMKEVTALTFSRGKSTAARRTSPIPQLSCNGGPACGRVPVDTVQCVAVGDAGNGNVQWRCEAQLPTGVRLTDIDVNCEGYDHPDDIYVLVGSCGLRYGLVDERGSSSSSASSRKYGSSARAQYAGRAADSDSYSFPSASVYDTVASTSSDWGSWIFFFLVLGILAYVFTRPATVGPTPAAPSTGGGGGGGGGNSWGSGSYGGGGSGPYYPGGGGGGTSTSGYTGSYTQTQYAPPPQPPVQGGWRPGFWTGMLGGTLLGRMMGGGQAYQPYARQQQYAPTFGGYGFGRGGYGGGAPAAAAPAAPSTTTATGYGGTSRR